MTRSGATRLTPDPASGVTWSDGRAGVAWVTQAIPLLQ